MTHPSVDMNDRREGEEWDVVVIGAGVAGCVLARELAREGLKTLLVESRSFPREKVCGGCLSGLAVSVFEQAGLMDAVFSAGAVPLRRFEAMRRGRLLQVPVFEGLAVSRTVLDDILARRATEAGVVFRDGTTATLVTAHAGPDFRQVRLRSHRGSEMVDARIVVAAAGLGRTCFEADSPHRSRFSRGAKLGAGCILPDGPASYRPGVIHMAIGHEGYLGLVRVAHGQLDVAGAFAPEFFEASGSPGAAAFEILRQAGFETVPELMSAKWTGTPPLTRRTRPLASDRVFLVGDTAGYVEPFTGEGMGWALASAMALKPLVVEAARQWNARLITEWERTYERVSGRRQGICRSLAAILERPALAAVAFQAARLAPSVTARIVRRIDAPSPPALESVIPS